MVVNGVLYGIPLHMDTLALFINDAIFADGGFSPPTTWEEFIRVALAATVKNEQGEIITSGAAIGTYNNIPHASDIISMLFAQNRVNLKNPSQSPEAVAEALSFYTNFASGRDNFESVWSSKQEDALSAFASGSVAMYFGFSWDIFAIKAKNPDLKFSVHKVPALTTPVSIASYWADGVSVKSKHQKEALLFLQFLAKKETQQKLYSEEAKIRLFGELPARRDLGESLAENTLIYPFIEQAKHAVSSPFASQTYDESLNDELNEYLQKAVNSILTTNTSPQSAAETFLQGVNQVFTRYGFK
jgi:ABC-type glycerol-3-phosphate transport system substrate-binding protein